MTPGYIFTALERVSALYVFLRDTCSGFRSRRNYTTLLPYAEESLPPGPADSFGTLFHAFHKPFVMMRYRRWFQHLVGKFILSCRESAL